MPDKKSARREAGRRERAVGEAYLRESGFAAGARFLTLEAYRAASTVFFYHSFGAEPDTLPLLRAALAAGKRVCLPRILGEGRMEAREVFSLAALVPGPWGIPEPPESAPLVPPEAIDLILVPGAAFDRVRYRLGRGGGYYDRYLPLSPALRVGLARERLLWDAVPREAHDLPVDVLVTETRSL